MLRIITILMCGILLLGFACRESESKSNVVEEQRERPQPAPAERSNPMVRLTTSMGNIDIELLPDVAPKHTENFLKLTREGFYDSLTFHRIVPGFVIQGGDPKGDGTGGPGYTVPAEFSDLKHVPGAVAAARRGDAANPTKASSGSQFYIVMKDAPFLDGEYTIFGKVVNGMDVAQAIEKVPLADPQMGRPKEPVYIIKAEVISGGGDE